MSETEMLDNYFLKECAALYASSNTRVSGHMHNGTMTCKVEEKHLRLIKSY